MGFKIPSGGGSHSGSSALVRSGSNDEKAFNESALVLRNPTAEHEAVPETKAEVKEEKKAEQKAEKKAEQEASGKAKTPDFSANLKKDKNAAYSILGVGKDASDREVRMAYRKLALENRADGIKNDPEKEDRMKQLNGAYEKVGNPENRKAYDQQQASMPDKPTTEPTQTHTNDVQPGANQPHVTGEPTTPGSPENASGGWGSRLMAGAGLLGAGVTGYSLFNSPGSDSSESSEGYGMNQSPYSSQSEEPGLFSHESPYGQYGQGAGQESQF